MTMPFQPAAFPYARPRRLRSQPWVRRLVAETTLTPADLIWPLIVHDGAEDRQPVASMPGVFRLSPKEAAKAAVEARDLGIPMVALFPNVNDGLKDNVATAATDPDGLIPDCIRDFIRKTTIRLLANGQRKIKRRHEVQNQSR